MFTVYVYVLDAFADWELGYVMAELNSGRFFREDAPDVSVRTVGVSKRPVRTMGRLTVVPECVVDDIMVDRESALLLPGADVWDDPEHAAVIGKAAELLAANAVVGAICGATAALADAGLLDHRPHTSNAAGYLEMVAPNYRGHGCYVDRPSVADRNLITASSAGALLWAKQIIERLKVFRPDTLEAWYAYFSTGDPRHFFALMQTLPTR